MLMFFVVQFIVVVIRLMLIFEFVFFCEFFGSGLVLDVVLLLSGIDDWEIDSS